MKKILLLLSLCIVSLSSFAHDDFNNGYRGYADLGYTIGIGDYKFGRFEVSTTHGYQVCPYFFVGAGVGFHFMQKCTYGSKPIILDKRDSKVSIPLYANLRGIFSKRKFAPFVDAKAGYFITNHDGFYGAASVGCRMRVKEKQAISLSVGYVYEKLEFESLRNLSLRVPNKLNCEGISIKIGYEF